VDEDYSGGCHDLKAHRHAGWQGVPTNLEVAVLQPHGHHRAIAGCSLGYEGVVRDIPTWLDSADSCVSIDRERVYACGLSMGGLESLLAVGHYPDVFAAAFVFNPVVDVARWHEDLASGRLAALGSDGGAIAIVDEVGGLPSEVPERYRERTPTHLLSGLAEVPLTIWWSRADSVVPRQTEYHGKHLYDALKHRHPNAPVSEYDHTARYGYGDRPSVLEGWAIHETSEYEFAMRWLLLHRLRSRLLRGHGQVSRPAVSAS